MNTNLCLHMGASEVTREQVAEAPTPKPTRTWAPLPHETLITTVENILPAHGLRVVGTPAHGMTHEGTRYFGLMQVANGHTGSEDYSWVLGLRNCHDKTFAAGLAVGSQVFVCDNLAFTGEIQVGRKHTTNILRDLPELVESAVRGLRERWGLLDARVDQYKGTNVTRESRVHDFAIRSIDEGVISASKLPALLKEWREPVHEEFRPRTVWSLFNAYTEVLKDYGMHDRPLRTATLHRMLDAQVGFNRV